ncbi:MAG TPA: glycosyltransferase family 39 protein [Solirubrobacteraceae bacterium]
MAALLIAALAVRVAYIEHTPFQAVNDAGTYNRLASQMARTGDYDTGSAPGTGAGGSRGPTAYFPPGFPYFLAAVDIVTGHQAGHKAAIGAARIAQAVAGTIAVGLVGLVALEAFGATAALVSMALAAFYPVFVELSGTLVAENLLLLFELGAVWTMLRARRAEHPYAWIAATGVLTGLATLTHENAILFAIPFAFGAWSVARGSARGPVILILITIATIAPWTIRNAIELHHFVPVSDETGITLRGTYNPESAAFAPVAYKWRFFWQIPQDADLRHTAGRYDEVQLGSKLQARALDYVGAHPTAPLEVAFHNTLRMFELEGSYAWNASARAIGLHVDVAQTGVVAFWILCLLALAGAFTRAARAAPRWLWGLPLLYALSIVLINVETPRFREPIDVFLILLAGCAVTAVLERLRGAPVRGDRRAPKLTGHAQLIEVVERLA